MGHTIWLKSWPVPTHPGQNIKIGDEIYRIYIYTTLLCANKCKISVPSSQRKHMQWKLVKQWLILWEILSAYIHIIKIITIWFWIFSITVTFVKAKEFRIAELHSNCDLTKDYANTYTTNEGVSLRTSFWNNT